MGCRCKARGQAVEIWGWLAPAKTYRRPPASILRHVGQLQQQLFNCKQRMVKFMYDETNRRPRLVSFRSSDSFEGMKNVLSELGNSTGPRLGIAPPDDAASISSFPNTRTINMSSTGKIKVQDVLGCLQFWRDANQQSVGQIPHRTPVATKR